MVHDLRVLLRWAEGRAPTPSAVTFDSATRQSTPESGGRGAWDGARRRKGSKLHIAVDTLGHVFAWRVPPADAQNRAQVATLAAAVQEVTGKTVDLAFVDQGYTGESAAAAAAQGIALEVSKLPDAKRGFVLLPRRWVVERSFAGTSHFRRLAKDDERFPKTVAGLYFVAFVSQFLHRLVTTVAQSP